LLGRSVKVETVSQAVTRIGLRQIKSIATAMALEQVFVSENNVVAMYMKKSWKKTIDIASVAISLMSLYLEKHKHTTLTLDTITLAALVHNIGVLPILTEAEQHPDIFANPTFLQDIWLKANHQLFQAFEGTNMKVSDHETVFKKILAVHQTVSTEKNYLLLENIGHNETKKKYTHKRFLNLAADLIDAGFSGTYLQRLHEKPLQNFCHFNVYIQIFKAFKKEIPAGTVSERKARNVERFYYDLEKFGYEEMKSKYSPSQFRNLIAALKKCGYSLVYLQNLHVQSTNNVIPFINMFEMKFEEQLPPNFIEPISTFSHQLRIA